MYGRPSETKIKESGGVSRFFLFRVVSYFLLSIISIVETIRDLVSPSLGGISAVPSVTLSIFRSFRNRFLVISATSTAVVIACPRAFSVISLALLAEKLVMIAST